MEKFESSALYQHPKQPAGSLNLPKLRLVHRQIYGTEILIGRMRDSLQPVVEAELLLAAAVAEVVGIGTVAAAFGRKTLAVVG